VPAESDHWVSPAYLGRIVAVFHRTPSRRRHWRSRGSR
jgi:hypothetical protein